MASIAQRILFLACWSWPAACGLLRVKPQVFAPPPHEAAAPSERLWPDKTEGNPFLATILAGRHLQTAIEHGRQSLALLHRLDALADADPDPEDVFFCHLGGNYSDAARFCANYAHLTTHASAKLNWAGGGGDLRASLALVQTADQLSNCPRRSARINCLGLRYRTIDGLCNNVEKPRWGSAFEPLNALLTPAFDDGFSSPRTLAADGRSRLPSPLEIVQAVHMTPAYHVDMKQGEVSYLFVTFARMVYQDMAHFVQSRSASGSCINCCGSGGAAHPECDVGQRQSGEWRTSEPRMAHACEPFVRMLPGLHSDCALLPRAAANAVTSYLDGSVIYGTDVETTSRLRAFRGGRMRTAPTAFELPPPAAANQGNCKSQKSHLPCFDFGAYNLNMGPDTAALGIIWLRQHNRIAAKLAWLNPQWNDDRLFEETRRIVVAQLQHITYNEYLPILLGRDAVHRYGLQLERSGPYYGYDRKRNAQAITGFPTANHYYVSMLTDDRLDTLISGLFNPSSLYSTGFIERVFTFVTTGEPNRVNRVASTPHWYAVQALLNANREGGLPPYVRFRDACQLPRVGSFDDLRQFMDADAVDAFSGVYRSVYDIDLYSGGLAEHQIDGGIVGPTFACILATQFQAARDGDRFWYENFHYPSAFTEDQLTEIRKTSLARLICDNTEVKHLQRSALLMPDIFENCAVSCDASIIAKPDWTVFVNAEPRVRQPISQDAINKALALAEQTADGLGAVAQLPPDQAPAVQTASFLNYAVLHPLGYAINISRVAAIFLEATRYLHTRPDLFSELKPSQLDANVLQSLLPEVDVSHVLARLPENVCLRRNWPCDHTTPYRDLSGWCNNLKSTAYGSSFVTFRRLLPPLYADAFNEPRTRSEMYGPLPSARLVSSWVHRPIGRQHSKYTHFVMQWGQFLDHDITHTPMTPGPDGGELDCSACDSAEMKSVNCFPIPIPSRDPFFPSHNPDGSPRCLPFKRSLFGQLNLGFRQQINQITSFHDASNVYGSDDCESHEIRAFTGGLMKVHETAAGHLLPPDVGNEGCRSKVHSCFRAGDVRVNEHYGLASTHTIWLREHNRIAARLHTLNPHWNDERIYQEARRIVSAFHQHITYNEFLPKVLGWNKMASYGLLLERDGFFTGYNENLDATISNEFATAAYRFGHTLIRSHLHTHSDGDIHLRDVFFDQDRIFDAKFIDSVFKGMAAQPAGDFDPSLSEDLANHLFEKADEPYSGLDLAALNIQRGRDHGLPPYLLYLRLFGGRVPRSFDEMRSFVRNESVDAMRHVYHSVRDVDLFTGLMAELPEPSAIVGPTTAHILAEQFHRLRHGDRFWYENGDQPSSFTAAQLAEIRKTSLAKTVCRHAPAMKRVQPQIFIQPDSKQNAPVNCDDLDDVDLKHWRDEHSCWVGKLSIMLGYSKKVSPCVSCTCTREGPVCQTRRVANCLNLLNEFERQLVLDDDSCIIQCHAFIRIKEHLLPSPMIYY